jgi:hypothetical protein
MMLGAAVSDPLPLTAGPCNALPRRARPCGKRFTTAAVRRASVQSARKTCGRPVSSLQKGQTMRSALQEGCCRAEWPE